VEVEVEVEERWVDRVWSIFCTGLVFV
jgi:hypothetical protein